MKPKTALPTVIVLGLVALALPAVASADGSEPVPAPSDRTACVDQTAILDIDGVLPAPLEVSGIPNCTEFPGCPQTCWFGGAQCSPSYCQGKCETVCEDPEVFGYCDSANNRCICNPGV